MTEPRLPVPVEPKVDVEQAGLVDRLMERLTDYINEVDEQAAAARVAALRQKQPQAPKEDLADDLIRQKCFRAGAVGAVTSGAALIPGLGTFASLTFGVAADIGMTFKLQAELVLEIATLYGYTLTPDEKRRVILLVTGISAGANQVLSKVGAEVAERATQRLAERAVVKAIPFIGVAASAGTNIVSTYVIGRRAQAYFNLGPEGMQSWSESLRAISGVDERKLTDWLVETTDETWDLVSRGVESAGQAVVVAGKSTGKVIVLGSTAAIRSVTGAGSRVWGGLSAIADAATDFVSDTYHSLRGRDEAEELSQTAEVLETSTVSIPPEASPEKPGYLARLWDFFDRDDKPDLPDERLATLPGPELVGQMVKEEEMVIGVVGADDELSEEVAPDSGFLSRLGRFFARFKRRDGSLDPDGPALAEHLVAESEQVTVLAPEGEPDEEEAQAVAKPGRGFRIFNFLKKK